MNTQPGPQPDHWVPKVAIALAVIGSTVLGWVAFGRSEASPDMTRQRSVLTSTIAAAIPTRVESSTTSTLTSVIDTTLLATTVPSPVESTLPAAAPTTIAPTGTVLVPPTTPAPSAILADPTPGAATGPGNHQVMNDTMASGPALAEVLPAFTTAEHLADVLATHDWGTAATLLPTYPYGTNGLATNYGSINRFSLLLLDARPDNGGFTLLLGAVTNEGDGSQTSERCLHWYADSSSVEIQAETLLQQFTVPFSAVDVRMNPDENGRVRNGCTW